MEQRKVIKLGPSSYAITLPAQWVEEYNISQERAEYIQNHKEFLTVYHKQKIESDEKKEMTIRFDSISLKVFNKLLISYYLKNYSRIKIVGEQVNSHFEQVKLYIDKLPHLEILSIKGDEIILEDSSRFQGLKIEDIFESLEGMLKSMFTCLEIADSQEAFIKMQILDKSVNKTYFKCIKALNYYIQKQEDFDIVKLSVYYMKIATLYEKTGDNLKRITRYLKQYAQNDVSFSFGDIVTSIEQVLELIISYRKSTALRKSEILSELNDKKMSILREIDERTHENPSSGNYNLELVVFQLVKDILGSFDEAIIANVDAYGLE